MASGKNLLTDREVRGLLAKKIPTMTGDGGGLYLRIRESGRGEWLFRYSLHGRDRWMPLADATDMPLETARKKTRALRVAVDDGRDPVAERREADAKARQRGTFRELAEDWYATEAEPRLKHPEAVRRALDNYLLPKLGPLNTDAVKPADCATLLERGSVSSDSALTMPSCR